MDVIHCILLHYLQVVLKHYGYQAEVAINALLEGSVPSRLEKYKSEGYLQPTYGPANVHDEMHVVNKLAHGGVVAIVAEDTELEKLASKLVIEDAEADGEKFFPGKRYVNVLGKNG